MPANVMFCFDILCTFIHDVHVWCMYEVVLHLLWQRPFGYPHLMIHGGGVMSPEALGIILCNVDSWGWPYDFKSVSQLFQTFVLIAVNGRVYEIKSRFTMVHVD